jgi:hypothetical protein
MTFERWTKHQWIPYDEDFPEGTGCWESSFADSWGEVEKTCHCGRPTAVVWHFDDLCAHDAASETPKLALCTKCATWLALGILRDVTEATFGEDMAKARYDVVKKAMGRQ